jgi:hypothetical protein
MGSPLDLPGGGGAPPPGPPGGGPGGPPAMPKSPIGGPGGPGGSPMLSPGGGAGNKAAAMQQVKAVIPALLVASMAFESGGKEQQALLRAISSLNPIFGRAEGSNMVPAGLQTMAQAAKQGPLSAAPPPGLKPDTSPPPGMDAPGGPPGGM